MNSYSWLISATITAIIGLLTLLNFIPPLRSQFILTIVIAVIGGIAVSIVAFLSARRKSGE